MTMKRLSILVFTFILATMTWFIILQISEGNGKVQAEETQTTNSNSITVSGNGELTVEPDVAFVTVAIETKGDTAKNSQEENAKIVKEVENVISDTFKLKKEDIQTIRFNVYPKYQYKENQAPVLLGYETNHSLKITYRDIQQIGKLLDDLTKAGVNRVDNIQFDTEKSDEYELAAIEKAMKNAKKKAEVIAKAENKNIKGIIHVVQGNPTFSNPISPYALTEAEFSMDNNNTSISSGQIKITTNVSVQYEF
ncbi:SIMPL domain-containing protein [Chengkuizengella sediminis]|uniref:SIMPL domain-containing protein n=1 Tax=Chengkuizengella sediminis TaxID=1885917 RepID=UPI001389BB56|nr:SIMPL domain-containing protein [Chengkuizengella sediminis]NDI36563.1 DUF541 domain-containing protein [Chengkuizengella sediminis]